MALLSSKTLIQAHALFLSILAVYLVVSPGVVTDSDIVFILGEAMHIDLDPSLTNSQVPFAICGVLLISEAIVDFIIVQKLPQMDNIIVTPQQRSNESVRLSSDITPLTVRVATLYGELWTFLAGARFCMFFALALFIYQSKPGDLAAWAAGSLDPNSLYKNNVQMKQGLDQLKSRVVFTYVFMEMMFWLWTLSNVREERREVVKRLAEKQAAEHERGIF